MTQSNPESKPRWGRHLMAALPALAVLLVAGAIVAYMMGSVTKAQRSPPPRAARLVEVVTVTPADRPITIEAWGTVQAARRVSLQSRVAGEVQSIGAGFEPGALLEKGELLLRIDPADYELAVRQRRSDLTRARAELRLEQGRRAVAEQEFALLGDEVTADQRGLILREPQLETARAAVASAEAGLAEAELNLKRTVVRTPFNALVLERGVDLGTRVGSGSTLAELADTDTFWVELAVPAASLQWMETPGARVRLYHPQVWGPQIYREGQVIRLRGDLDEKGRMARLLVSVPDPLGSGAPDSPRLLLGAFLRGEIEGRALPGVFALDPAWLRDGNTVWVMAPDGRLAVRPVAVVYRGSREVYVADGLAPGERLVTSDLGVPVEGMALRVAGEPPAPVAPREGSVPVGGTEPRADGERQVP